MERMREEKSRSDLTKRKLEEREKTNKTRKRTLEKQRKQEGLNEKNGKE